MSLRTKIINKIGKVKCKKLKNVNFMNEKRINVVAHCYLNSETRVKGIKSIDGRNIQNQINSSGGQNEPIIQLPCPEIIYFGMNRRENTKDQFDFPNYRRFCRDLFMPYADMIEMFKKNGYQILITGVSKSPSCGALTTSVGGKAGKCDVFENRIEKGKGVFFEEIENELKKRNIQFEMNE